MKLKELLLEIKGDLRGKASIHQFIKSYFYSARFRLLLNHRIGKFFYKSNNYILRQVALRYKYKMLTKRNCDISYEAIIGKGIRLPHPIGIVIGQGVIIDDNVTIFQHVTFGSHGRKELNVAYPHVKKHAKIYAGAKIIGGITIGENAIIGANSLVNKDVPNNSTAYGIPCKIKML